MNTIANIFNLELLSIILSSAIASAIISGIFNLVIQHNFLKKQNKIELKNKKIEVYIQLESIINLLIKKQSYSQFGFEDYYSIYHNIDYLKDFRESLIKLKSKKFHLSKSIVIYLDKLESIINTAINEIEFNLQNDEYSIIKKGIGDFNEINNTIKALNEELSSEYVGLKK